MTKNYDSNWSLLLLEVSKYLIRHLFASTFVYKTVSIVLEVSAQSILTSHVYIVEECDIVYTEKTQKSAFLMYQV